MFTLEEVKKAVGGKLVSKTDAIVFATAINVTGVSTDTRTIKEGELFIALQGENFDGNKFLAKSIELGACAVVTNDEEAVPEGAVAIIVEDTVHALGLLANHYRFKLGCKVIAITGSVGKTSTRTMITEVLNSLYHRADSCLSTGLLHRDSRYRRLPARKSSETIIRGPARPNEYVLGWCFRQRLGVRTGRYAVYLRVHRHPASGCDVPVLPAPPARG